MLSTVLIIFYHCNTVVSSVFVEDQIVDFVFDSIRCSTKQLSNNLRNETVNSTKSNKFDSHEYWWNHIQLLTMEQGFVLNNVRFSQRKKISYPFHVWDTKRFDICYVYYNKSNLLVCLYNHSPIFLIKIHT